MFSVGSLYSNIFKSAEMNDDFNIQGQKQSIYLIINATIILFTIFVMLRLEASIPTVLGRLVGLQIFFVKVCNTKKWLS